LPSSTDDHDWRAGTIMIRGPRGKRHDRMAAIPEGTSAIAIADYIPCKKRTNAATSRDACFVSKQGSVSAALPIHRSSNSVKVLKRGSRGRPGLSDAGRKRKKYGVRLRQPLLRHSLATREPCDVKAHQLDEFRPDVPVSGSGHDRPDNLCVDLTVDALASIRARGAGPPKSREPPGARRTRHGFTVLGAKTRPCFMIEKSGEERRMIVSHATNFAIVTRISVSAACVSRFAKTCGRAWARVIHDSGTPRGSVRSMDGYAGGCTRKNLHPVADVMEIVEGWGNDRSVLFSFWPSWPSPVQVRKLRWRVRTRLLESVDCPWALG